MAEWTFEEIARLQALQPRYCEFESCENGTDHERQWLFGDDPDDLDRYVWIRECGYHATLPDERVYAEFRIRPKAQLLVRDRRDETEGHA